MIVDAQDAQMVRRFGWGAPLTLPASQLVVRRWVRSWQSLGLGWNSAIVDEVTGQMIGDCEAELRGDGFVHVLYAVFAPWRGRAAYRDRTAGAARQKSRIAEIETKAIDRLTLNGPWLVLSLVPDLPGDFPISAGTYDTFENEMPGRSALQLGSAGAHFMRTSVGRRRFLADDGGSTPLAEWCSLELHTDGSGVFGVRLWDMYEDKRHEGQPVVNLVADESLASTMSGLVWLGSHAQDRAAAGGNAVVRAQLVPASGADSMEIGDMRFYGTPKTRSAMGQKGIMPVAETVAALDDLTTGCPGLAVVIAALGNELGQTFGIPELGQFTPSGELNLRYWRQESHQDLRAWAEQHGIGTMQQG